MGRYGGEFYNKEVQKLVTLYSTENEEKSGVAERWNRTMKEKMFKYFSANSTRRYIDVLDEFVEQYNNTKHSSIGMTPNEASKKENETKVWRNLYGDYHPPNRKTPKFSIGDNVRITRKKKERSRKGIHRDGLRKFLQFQTYGTRIRLPIKL